ncbi:5357_t:CDS:2 [Ambispora gerdemannii]|uniref:5357_t:CDS:1 n=1 Tax=Ambispora gerdemannii TaxID=144530 RepID=A0A9N9C4Z5_9GLOM|nr:5357_t:CDS:2 [Ambispora gerdemannii]
MPGKNTKKIKKEKSNTLLNKDHAPKPITASPITFINVNKTPLSDTNIEITLQKEISESLKIINQTQNISQILKANVNEPLTHNERPITPKKNSNVIHNTENTNKNFNLELNTPVPKFATQNQTPIREKVFQNHDVIDEDEIITVSLSSPYIHNNHSNESLSSTFSNATVHHIGEFTDDEEQTLWQIVTRKTRHHAFIPEDNITLNTLDPAFLGLFNPSPKSFKNFRIEFSNKTSRDKALIKFKKLEININSTAISPAKSDESIKQPTKRNGIVILDIPVNMSEETVKSACNSIGSLTEFKCIEKGGWKSAHATFMEPDDELNLNNTWSIMIKHDSMRTIPANSYQETLKSRSTYELKLANLPPRSTAYALQHVINQTRAKSCFIPRS